MEICMLSLALYVSKGYCQGHAGLEALSVFIVRIIILDF